MVFFSSSLKYKKCLPVIYDIPWLVAKMAFYGLEVVVESIISVSILPAL